MSSAAVSQDLAQLLRQAERRVTDRLFRLLAAGGVSLDEWRVLSCLANGAGRSMSEIADFALLPAPTLTKVVDRMVAANLVHRGVDVRDRRRVLALLAPRGRALYRRLARVVQDDQAELQETFGTEALDDLTQLLTQLISSLDGKTAPSPRTGLP